jgi:hypothetical protein
VLGGYRVLHFSTAFRTITHVLFTRSLLKNKARNERY